MDEPRLSQESRQMLRFLTRWISVMGFAPSLRELATKSNMTINGAKYHLLQLQLAGKIERQSNTARGIRIVKRKRRKLEPGTQHPAAET